MPSHPYRELWQTRDLGTWGDALAADVVVRSPMLKTPFHGRDTTLELFDVLLGVFGDFRITDEFEDGAAHAFFWRATSKRRCIEGADLVRHGDDGKIAEITVLIRPLADIGTFAAAVGPVLARRRGSVAGFLATLVSAPLRLFLVAVDAVATRLIQPRRLGRPRGPREQT